MESVEIVAGVISRYTLMEQMYCSRCVTDAEQRVRASIISMYSAILTFLCKASMYFGRSLSGKSGLFAVTQSQITLVIHCIPVTVC